jgi:hypothetical protein
MRRLLTILTSDQRKLLTNETQTDSSKIDDSQLNESPKTTNTDDDTKLHVARYYKSETDWEELLTQVCSSPMKGKDKKCSSFFTIMIVRVPPSSLVSFFLLPLLHKTEKKKIDEQ